MKLRDTIARAQRQAGDHPFVEVSITFVAVLLIALVAVALLVRAGW